MFFLSCCCVAAVMLSKAKHPARDSSPAAQNDSGEAQNYGGNVNGLRRAFVPRGVRLQIYNLSCKKILHLDYALIGRAAELQ